jgi:hypothetical protein
MRYPVNDRHVSNPYGQITADYFHYGVDFPNPGTGAPLFACKDFSLYQAPYWSKQGGWSVALRFDDGVIAYYQHMQEKSHLTTGGSEGAIVGAMGNTGSATSGPHLHFATYRQTASGLESFDPIPWLDQGIAAGGGAIPLPIPGEEDEDEMSTGNGYFTYERSANRGGGTVRVVFNTRSGFFEEHADPAIKNADILAMFGESHAVFASLTQGYRDTVLNECNAVKTGTKSLQVIPAT